MYMYDPTVGLSSSEKMLIVGGEVELWGEHIDETNVEAVLYPRACAVGECVRRIVCIFMASHARASTLVIVHLEFCEYAVLCFKASVWASVRRIMCIRCYPQSRVQCVSVYLFFSSCPRMCTVPECIRRFVCIFEGLCHLLIVYLLFCEYTMLCRNASVGECVRMTICCKPRTFAENECVYGLVCI